MTRLATITALLVLPLTVHTATAPQIDVRGVLAVGFFPPVTQKELDEDDGSLREGVDHLNFALEDLMKCLKSNGAVARLEHTRSILLRDGARTHELHFSTDWAHAVGIVLIEPGKSPLVVYATAGPGTLQYVALEAAADYFAAPECKVGID